MNILITGASGLIGSKLTQLLLEKGHAVRHLSRSKANKKNAEVFQWDISESSIEPDALNDLDAVVHLAGESVAAKKWSSKQKTNILSSRIDSAKILKDSINKLEKKPSIFISASGIGYYGIDTADELMTEVSPKGDGFLADVVDAWETSADQLAKERIRTIKLRIGVVLAQNGGALEKMILPIKLGIGSPLGSGKQFMSWVHIDDLCNMITYCLENESVEGVYNAVSPNPVTNKEMTRSIARTLRRPLFMPRVPGFLLKILLGEMASIVTGGNKVSSEKIRSSGFTFEYENIDNALNQILSGD